MMLAGCSNDEPTVGGNEPTIEGDAEMYVSLVFGSKQRAFAYDDGDAAESEIRDVTLYFFDGTDITTAKYIGSEVGVITSDALEGTNKDNITKTVKVTAKSDIVTTAKGVVAVVNKVPNFTPNPNSTFEDFNKALEVAARDAEILPNAAQGFMMTNATYVDGNNVETCIAEVTEANWKETTSTEVNTPVEIYVERVAAKVKLTVSNDLQNTTASVQVINWGFNVVNKTYYPIKKLGTFLAGLNELTGWPGLNKVNNDYALWNKSTDHRSFWAVDPNYGAENTADAFLLPSVSEMNYKANDIKYLPENTMNWDKEVRQFSTSAIIFAKYVPNDLVGAAGDGSWFVYKNANYTAAGLASIIAKNVNTKYYKKAADFETSGAYVTLELTDFEVTYGNAEDITINGTVVGKSGNAVITLKDGIEVYTSVDNGKNVTPSTAAAVNADLAIAQGTGDAGKIKAYVGGYCYYEVPIRQFYDDEVPFDSSLDNVLAPKHLGRYGVVRNHSYQLNVNSIMEPGEPIDSDKITPDGPDDKEKEYLIDVTIKVLAWAVRVQNIGL